LEIIKVLAFHEDIFRLDIPMGYVPFMHVVYSQKDLFQDRDSILFSEYFYFDDLIIKFPSLKKL
jgi:hypothetical protein